MIDSDLLAVYVSELDALRTHGRTFAAEYPAVASRLDIGARRSSDPQVERLIESTAFLAARLRLQIERSVAEVPLAMLTLIAPSLVEPVPSMALVRFDGGGEPRDVPRDSRLDAALGGGALVCFSTTMPVTIAPVTLGVRRLAATAAYADGIGVKVTGSKLPARLTLCLGNSERSAATLMDAMTERLVGIDIISSSGDVRTVPIRQLRIHGFSTEDAALPVRPASHPAHRVVMEFMNFPDKFRFVSLAGPFATGDEIRFRFDRPLTLEGAIRNDLVSVNTVPVINLWPSGATPIDIDGRRLEYPVRVDALRYRTVECHSVQSLDLFQSGATGPQRLDPVVGFGAVNGTALQWGTRRTMTPTGGEVYVYFRGLDYARTLGRQEMLASPTVLASNRNVAQSIRVGTALQSFDGIGNWSPSLVRPPTAYIPGLGGANAMRVMIGYLNSSMVGLLGEARRSGLCDYLGRFPGAHRASWPRGIGRATTRGVMVMRGRQPTPGVALVIDYDGSNYPTTSQGIVKRVLGQLFDSQRGLNRIEEIIINGT